MKFFFNELSLQNLEAFSQISETYSRLKYVQNTLELSELPDLIFYRNTLYFKIKEDKKLADVLLNPEVRDKELQDYLLSQISNAPFLEEYEENEQLISFQYTHCGKDCYGFAIAHQESLSSTVKQKVASFCSHHEWENFNISVNFINQGHINTDILDHLGSPQNVDNFEQSWLWHEIQKKLEVNSTESLIRNIERLSHILLSPKAIDDIRSRGEDLIFINKINDILNKINDFCLNCWSKNSEINWSLLMKKKAIRVRPESEHTLINYSSERTYENENGSKEVFSLHLDVRGTAEKMYLKTINETNKVFIAFITTKHLTTMKY
jgi:hypothetical protein